ncbi:MAG: hypothetical protein F4187_07790 [Gemmatimonadetes bacterium]|nr:hypothetical protein [Gemmatimonadota bacterium]
MDHWRATTGLAARALATAGLFALLALGGCDPAPDAGPTNAALEPLGNPCPRGPGRVFERGAVEDVTNDPPCRLVFRPTGVRLAALGDGSRHDPGPLVVKDSRGRYYSTNATGWGATISVWSEDGSYLSSFGRVGEGPGEFAGDYLALLVDGGDSLHVRDLANWSLFSPDHEYVRRAPSRMMGRGDRETTVVYYDGRILSSDGSGAGSEAYFTMANRDGTLDEVFGTAEDGSGAGGHYGHERAIAYRAGYASFWAAPSQQGSTEYAFEEWYPVGDEGLLEEERVPVIVRTLHRHQPWFNWTGNRYTSPAVLYIHITADDLLYVHMWRPSEEYLEAMKPFEDRMTEGRWTMQIQDEVDALMQSLTHFVIEVIDVRSEQLLASETYPVAEVMEGDPLLAQRFFRNEFTGYAYNIGEDGLPYVEIIEGMLVEK